MYEHLHVQAYTSQMVAITMMALALSEDSITRRAKRDAIIDGLGRLPDTLRQVRISCGLIASCIEGSGVRPVLCCLVYGCLLCMSDCGGLPVLTAQDGLGPGSHSCASGKAALS